MPDETLSTERYGSPEQTEPLSDSPDVLVDKYGAALFDVADEYSDDIDVVGEGIISPATMSYLVYGLYNADFRFGPPASDSPIDVNNALPYWRFVTVAGGIQAKWVEDANSWSGYGIEWSLRDTQTGDEAYFEQIVPIDSSELWGHFRSILLPYVEDASSPLADPFIEVEYYDAAGSAVGGGTRLQGGGNLTGGGWGGSFALGFDEASDAVYVQQIPTEAKYAAYRFGVYCDTNDTGVVTQTVTEVYARQPDVITVAYSLLNNNFSATASKNLYVAGGGDWTTFSLAAAYYIATWAGFAVGVSTRHASDRSAGNIQISAYNATDGAIIGPTAWITATNPRYNAASTPIGDHVTADFVPGDVLRGDATTSSWSASGTNENFSHVTLACFELLNNTT